MVLSKQFRALAKVAGFFASVWGAIGVGVGIVRGPAIDGGSLVSGMLTFGLMYGAAGGIAGAATALLVARAESGRRLEEVATWRFAAWGMIGGLAPAALFSGLALIFGAPVGALAPLLGLGVVGGGIGGAVSATASTAAKKAALPEGNGHSELPAT